MSINNPRPIYLQSLEMEGFQCFIKPVRLDFSAITLLYGPNSAGKSAVFDALDLAKEFWSTTSNAFEDYSESAFYLKARKWKHLSKNRDANAAFARIAIEVMAPSSKYKDSQYYKLTDYPSLEYNYIEPTEDKILHDGKQIKFEFCTNGGVVKNISIYADKKPIIQISDRELKVYENFDMPSKPPNLPEIMSQEDNRRYSDELTHSTLSDSLDDFKFERSSDYFFRSGSLNTLDMGFDVEGRYWQKRYDYSWKINPEDEELYSLLELAREILRYFGNILVVILNEASPLVSASRSIPTPVETHAFVKGVDLGRFYSDNHIDEYALSQDSISTFLYEKINHKDIHLKLLANLAKAKIIHNRFSHAIYDVGKQLGDLALEDAAQFDTINKYLSDYLFAEKGYRVDADIKFLFDLNNSNITSQVEDILLSPVMVKLYLFDSDNRRLEFEDVGSGIAFVLPVLVSISGYEISQIQQPELHLHPALQASLTDAIIDRHNDYELPGMWQTIIETHSEHLLLRLLRRIKETELNRQLDGESDHFEWFQENYSSRKSTDIFPDDVAIFYFNPLIEGGVEIRKMLVTPLGDFYNTWPRGFFEERYKDLFGE